MLLSKGPFSVFMTLAGFLAKTTLCTLGKLHNHVGVQTISQLKNSNILLNSIYENCVLKVYKVQTTEKDSDIVMTLV